MARPGRLGTMIGRLRAAAASDRPPPPPPAPGVAPARAPSWAEESASVAGGSGIAGALAAMDGLARVLDSVLDALGLPFTDDDIARMLVDPAVSAATSVLALGLVEHPLLLEPALAPPPGYRPGTDPSLEAEAAVAAEVLHFNRRAVENLAEPVEDVLLRMGLYPARRTELAELVFEPIAGVPLGVGTGWTVRRIKPLPRDAWRFVGDGRGGVQSVYCRTDNPAVPGGWEVLPREKFCWLTWRADAGDPRGTSALRPARGAWAFKAGHGPDLSAYLRRFGQPVVKGTTTKSQPPSDASAAGRDVLEALGIEGASSRAKLSDTMRRLMALIKWRAGGALALAEGEDATLIEPQGKGEALLNSLAWWDRQIILAILLNPRGLLESEHNSRADSETAQDMIDRIVRVMRRQASRMVAWQVLWTLNWANFGREAADRYTPAVSLGGPDQPDLAAEGAMWVAAGWTPAPSHLPVIDARLGLPARGPDEGAGEQEQEEGDDDDDDDADGAGSAA